MARHVGHLCACGFSAEPAVERLRNSNATRDQRRSHEFGLPSEGKSMPGEVAISYCFFDNLALLGGSPFEKFVEQPGPSSPDVAFLSSRIAKLSRGVYCLRKIFAEESLYHAGLCVCESCVKMTLERHQHSPYVG